MVVAYCSPWKLRPPIEIEPMKALGFLVTMLIAPPTGAPEKRAGVVPR
jgi:hypothetical protein